MKVKVTAKHIKEGIPGSCTRCPVALALREHFKGVAVFEEVVLIKKHYCYLRRGTQFIKNFDEGKKVRPCTIELTLQ